MKQKFDLKIKEWAGWLTSKTEVMLKEVESKNISLEDIITVVIKIFIVFVALSILKWPFHIIEHSCRYVFANYNMEFGFCFIIWNIILKLLYWLLSLLVIFIIFQDELFASKAKKPAKVVKEPKKEVKMEEDNPYNILWIIFKVLVFLAVTLPLIIANIGLAFAIASIIYLIIKGVFLYGILILLVGMFGLNVFIINTINNLFKGRKVKIWSLIISSILILVGIFATLDWALGLTIKQGKADNVTKDIIIMNRSNYDINRHNFEDFPLDVEYKVDANVPADKVLVKVTYDKDYLDYVNIKNGEIAEFKMDNLYEFKAFSEDFINNLKKDTIYVPYIELEVRATADVMDTIKR